MKILFLGDYSNLHACLASVLKKRGHEVTVVSDGGRYMDTARDILLDRRPGPLGSVRYFFDLLSVIPKIKGYDVVQLINPHFLRLRPEKLRRVFDLLKRRNGSVFLTLAGNDYHFVKACLDGGMFRFSEFKVGAETTEFERTVRRAAGWTGPGLGEYADYLYGQIDGAMSVLPEYDMASRPALGDRLAFTNLPVDLANLPCKGIDTGREPVIFIGMRGGMEIQKGTAKLLEISRELERELPGRCRVECVTNLPLREYLRRMGESHIVLDQLYSYSPGMNGLQAMALGKVSGTGAQPEYYRYLGEPEERPVFRLSPLEDVKGRLRELVLDPERMARMGEEGRRLVERNNDVELVATRFENHWERILSRR